MKKLWLQLIVVLILALTFIAFPLLVYTPIPQAISLNTQANNTDHSSQLIWFKNPKKEQFFALPKQKYPDDAKNKTPYLLPTHVIADFYDNGSSYLIVPESALGKFLVNHSTELNATPAYVVRSASTNKYQIVATLLPAIEVTKQMGSHQIVLYHLSAENYNTFLKQSADNMKISQMIVAQDPIQHSISIDPTARKISTTFWLQHAWRYLKSSLDLQHISGVTDEDTAHN